MTLVSAGFKGSMGRAGDQATTLMEQRRYPPPSAFPARYHTRFAGIVPPKNRAVAARGEGTAGAWQNRL